MQHFAAFNLQQFKHKLLANFTRQFYSSTFYQYKSVYSCTVTLYMCAPFNKYMNIVLF